MAGRRAVGASLAAVVIFSSVLISNFLLVSGEQQKMALVSEAAEERSLFDKALVAKSAAILELLDRMQATLSSSRFSCSNATNAVSRIASSENARIELDSVLASSTLSEGQQQTLYDNLTAMRPFSGSVADWTNFLANVTVHGRSPDGSVVLDRSETHFVTLPLRLPALVGGCLQDISAIASDLEGIGGQLCNESAVYGTLGSTAGSLSASAEAAGFAFFLSYSVSPPPPCVVTFAVSLVQDQIQGPESPFSFGVEEAGVVYWPRAP